MPRAEVPLEERILFRKVFTVEFTNLATEDVETEDIFETGNQLHLYYFFS